MTTSVTSARPRAAMRLSPAPVGWTTVAVLAILLAFADGFVLTSVLGAVGAIERAQQPFAFWLRTSALTVPVFVLAVLVALAVARRLVGPALRGPERVVVAALLIAVAGGVVGTGEMVVSAGYDYRLQSELAQTMDMTHPGAVAPGQATDPTACTGTCAAQQAQFDVDLRAARLGSVLVLGADLVVVGWVLAMRGGGLETNRPAGRRRRPGPEGAVRTGWVHGPQGSPSR
jgi:hypothetical protein